MTSAREARVTTREPRHRIRKPKNAALPHWAGETHASPVASIAATRPKFVGLKTCFPFQRIANLLAIVAAATRAARASDPVRRRRASESPEMRALLGSNAGSLQTRVHASCADTAAERRRATLGHETSKARASFPYRRRPASEPIW